MRKILLTILFMVFFLSCEENINYLADFEEQYSFNCVLRSDKNIQFATIKKSYPPGEENQNTDVKNAIISLILPDTTLHFKDSVLSGSSSNSVKSVYYLDNYTLTKDTEISIEANLPDGTMLTSNTHSADYYNLRLNKDGLSPGIIPVSGSAGEEYYYNWIIFGDDEPVIFGPGFYIKYYISGNEDIIYYKEVKGRYRPQIDYYEIPLAFLDETMQRISNGIDDKSTINIIGACLEVKVYDTALGVYANSIQTFEDEFSIRISEPNISNINGGLGIFGTYISEKFDIDITFQYTASYGYTPAPR